MFKRREKRTTAEKLREWILPVSGWRRVFIYHWRRLQRLNASPHSVALGFAIGVYVSFSPFVGFHLALSGLFAWLFRCNILASMAGNFLGNPITYPLMWAADFAMGDYLLGRAGNGPAPELTLAGLSSGAWDLFLPFMTGSIPVGLIAALIFYFPVKAGIARYQAARQLRLMQSASLAESGKLSSQTLEAQ